MGTSSAVSNHYQTVPDVLSFKNVICVMRDTTFQLTSLMDLIKKNVLNVNKFTDPPAQNVTKQTVSAVPMGSTLSMANAKTALSCFQEV